jgi:hypothetical protein
MGPVKPVHLLLALAAIFLASCAQTEGTTIGVVTAVEGSLTAVESFTVLASSEEITFVPIEGVEYEFALVHLREHQRTGEPIVVDWELRDEIRYATSLTDG